MKKIAITGAAGNLGGLLAQAMKGLDDVKQKDGMGLF